MPRYRIEIERDYVNRERVTALVEGDTPEEALAQLREQALDGELDENLDDDFSEIDGGPASDSYEFKVFASKKAGGALLLTGDTFRTPTPEAPLEKAEALRSAFSLDVADRVRAGVPVAEALVEVLGGIRDGSGPRTTDVLQDLEDLGVWNAAPNAERA